MTTEQRAPDLQGVSGRAWVSLPRTNLAAPDMTLANWLLHCPASHPLWPWYMVSLIHLRPVDGVKEAQIRIPGAQHELVIIAIDPGLDPDPDPDSTTGYHYLRPINLAEQFVVPDDAAAIKLAGVVVQSFVHGGLSPDTDWRSLTEEAIQAIATDYRGTPPA